MAEKLGLSYEQVKQVNPRLIYGEVSGYGQTGPWSTKPGQDLLAQCISGLPYLNGNKEDAPTPLGLSLADMFAGQHLVQGILAALIRREQTGQGAYIQVNLLESILDIQFEVLTTYLNDGHELPVRSASIMRMPIFQRLTGFMRRKKGILRSLCARLLCWESCSDVKR